MDSFVSSQCSHSYASSSRIPPSSTLATINDGHLRTAFRLGDANPKQGATLPSHLLGTDISARQHAKKRSNKSTVSEPNKTTSLQSAQEHLHTGTATQRLRSQSTDKSTHHFLNLSHQYASEGGEGPNFPEIDIALKTSRTSRRWPSSSTIEEEADDSECAPYTGTKEGGRFSMQVGLKVLDATMKNKVLVSFLQTYHISHTLTRSFVFSSYSSWSLALPFFIRLLVLVGMEVPVTNLVSPMAKLDRQSTGWMVLPF